MRTIWRMLRNPWLLTFTLAIPGLLSGTSGRSLLAAEKDPPAPTGDESPSDNARASAAKSARPDAARPDAARSDAARSDAARPDAARPDAARPDDTALPFLSEDARFQGMYAGESFAFHLPETWSLKPGAKVLLELSHSQLLTASSMTISIDGVAVQTLRLSGEEKAGSVTVPIPAGRLVPGWNSIRFQFYLRASDDACRDLDNPGLWAVVGKGSRIVAPHGLGPVVPDLARFPDSFVQPDRAGESPRVTFLMAPDAAAAPEGSAGPGETGSGNGGKGDAGKGNAGPGDAALEAAALLAAGLGQTRALGADSLRGYFLKGSAPPGLADAHLIFVGTLEQLKRLSTFGIDTRPIMAGWDRLKAAHAGVASLSGLVEVVSPLEPQRRMLAALATDASGLKVLAANLRRLGSSSQWSGAGQAFLGEPAAATVSSIDPDRLTLKSLGLSDLSLRGISSRTVSFRAPVPRHWRLTDQAVLKLYLSHSITRNKSAMFEVELNGAPVSSLELAPDLGAESTRSVEMTVPIPANLRQAAALDVRFRFWLDVGADDCSRPYDEAAWATVRSDSYLLLAHEEVRPLELNQYPDRFVGPGLAGVGLVLGADADSAGLTALLSVAGVLGERAHGEERLELRALTGASFAGWGDADRAARDWILIDEGMRDPTLRGLAEKLPGPLEEGGRLSTIFRQTHPQPEGSDEPGIIEMMRSPWQAERTLLVATAGGSPGMGALARVLGQPWGGDAPLGGNVSLVTDSGRVLHYGVLLEDAPPAGTVSSPSSGRGLVWLGLSVAGFAGALGIFWGLRRGRPH